MNESTFEARVPEVIRNLFPNYVNLDITHQKIFSVTLGHETIDVKPTVRKPRLDILIKQKERNLAVLELKKPGHSLREEDRNQGLSYARLLVPMPPLVIISNGEESRFYETISGEPLDIQNPDAEQLEKQFAQAFEIAATQKDLAIRTLLGKDPLIWEKVIDVLNRNSFQNYIGSVDALYEPIADTFHLPRQITQRIVELISGNNPVVAVTGAPMVGKTNVLYQICQLEDTPFVPIYINVEGCQFGIFQYLANHFTKHYFSVTSTDDIRHWLQHGIARNRHPAGKIVFIIDDVRYSNKQLIREIDELIELCSSGRSCSVIVACDSSNYHSMAYIPGRQSKTLFGKRALKVEVNNLNDEEFNQAREFLMEHWSVGFYKGAQYSRELRNLRILRMLLSELPHTREVDTQLLIPSFLSFRALRWILKGFSSDPKFIDDMTKLVKVSMESELNSSPSILESMVSYGRGHVPYYKAEDILGEGRIERLFQQGHIDWFTDKEENQYIAPKVPEILAAAAVEALVRTVRGMEFEQATDYVLKKSERLPYGDLIAASVFTRLSDDTSFSVHKLIIRLVEEPPRIEKVTEDFRGAIYSDKTGLLEIPQEIWKETSEETRMFSNLFPWLVLSQLATALMIVEGTEDRWIMYRDVLKIVGGYRNVLRRFDPVDDIEDTMGYMVHSLISKNGETGEVLCGDIGIIEPITYAMQRGFYDLPDEMLKICQYAAEQKDAFLSHRLHNAARSMIGLKEEGTVRVIENALRILQGVLREVH